MTTWDNILTEINAIKVEFTRLHKCLQVTKGRSVRPETFEGHLNNYIAEYNKIIVLYQKHYNNFTSQHKQSASDYHTKLRDKVVQLFSTLHIRIIVPYSYRIIDPSNLDNDTDSDSDSDMPLSADDFLSLAGTQIKKLCR